MTRINSFVATKAERLSTLFTAVDYAEQSPRTCTDREALA